MWCIGSLTEEYRQRMYGLLDLYARPLRLASDLHRREELATHRSQPSAAADG
jgi:hypothetical protein